MSTSEDGTIRLDEEDRDDIVRIPEGSNTPGSTTPLLPQDDARGLMTRWEAIQVRFVDDPRDAVTEADQLVAELVDRLTRGFAEERAGLEGRWEREEEVSTEDLRVTLQRYRSFFQRLLAA